jgi:hypothetical protein
MHTQFWQENTDGEHVTDQADGRIILTTRKQLQKM